MAYALHHRGQIATASGLDILAGIWLLISPFVLAFSHATGAMVNDVVLGIVIAVLAAIRFFGAYRQAWLSWINAILGIWVLISPWVVGYAFNRVALTDNVVLGIIVIILACWSALATDTTTTGTDFTGTPQA